MPDGAVNKKSEELKVLISRLEEQIKMEKLNPKMQLGRMMDRMTYLKRKLNIFKELLSKYMSS